MPENAVNENQAVSAQDAGAQDETSLERLERERLSRRAALRRMGVTSALSVFALFSVDDLARMVGAAMERRAGDSKIAEQVAHEFSQVGIALAAGPSGVPYCPCHPQCNGDCNCLCTFDKCVTLRQLCIQYPGCCTTDCQPGGFPTSPSGTDCTAYNFAVIAAGTRETACNDHPQKYHPGCI